MSEFFKGIGKISFEGKDSKNPLAFKHYNPVSMTAIVPLNTVLFRKQTLS